MTLQRVEAAARAAGLVVLGGLRTPPGDPLRRAEAENIVLLGPDEPRFWPMFRESPEFRDGSADPLDRWSLRVIGGMAEALGAQAFFPFGGPPHLPFTGWALAGGCHPSPVRLLVHPERGLFASFRGALGFSGPMDLPEPAPSPCDTCDGRPCLSACPVGALTGRGYDEGMCHAYLDTPDGAPCRTTGCAVRRACPVGAGLRSAGQSEFHMKAFHPWP